MEVALKLFSEQGFYQTTTKQIASEAEVNEITLFRHFGNKESLFQETTAHYVEDIDLKGEIDRLVNQDFEKSVVEVALDYLEFCKKNEKLYKIQMRLSEDMKEFVKLKLSRGFKKELHAYFTHLLSEDVIQGDPEQMAATFINSILGAFTIYVLTRNSFTTIPLDQLVIEHAKQFATYYRKTEY